MRLLVLGAAGRTGRHVVAQSLGHKDEVVVFGDELEPEAPGAGLLSIVEGGPLVPATIAPALAGVDAVVSALEPSSSAAPHALSDGTANLIRAMTTVGIDRLVVLSATGAGTSGGRGLPLGERLSMAAPWTRAARQELRRMEGDVMLSDLDWTIVRPARLTDGPQTGEYRVVEGGPVPGGSKVSRADAAALILKAAEAGLYSRRIVSAAY